MTSRFKISSAHHWSSMLVYRKPLAAVFQFQGIVWNQETTEKFPGFIRHCFQQPHMTSTPPPSTPLFETTVSLSTVHDLQYKPQWQKLTWCRLVTSKNDTKWLTTISGVCITWGVQLWILRLSYRFHKKYLYFVISAICHFFHIYRPPFKHMISNIQ